MDKICTKLLVFEGAGQVREWVGSYTDLREKQKAESERPRVEKVEREVRETGVDAPARKKLTYSERLELERIDKEMPDLEARKEQLLQLMATGSGDHHRMMEHSIELERTVKELDRMTDRWLDLSDRSGA
jgi:ATP-binding cassette subfamily F protein uup